MPRRVEDWFNQAIRDPKHAEADKEGGFYEWACISAQQAAEKAVKELYQALGIDAWGYSVWRLLDKLPQKYRPGEEVIDLARELDRFYVPTRYPNAHPEGAPYEYYTEDDARRRLKLREEYWNSVKIKLKRLDANKIFKQVKEEVSKLEDILCAIIFGSFARGNYSGTSDVDLLLIIRENLPMSERYRRYNRIRADTDVQVLIFTIKEVLERLYHGDTFIVEIITTGVPIKGEKIFETLQKIAKEIINKYRLKRTKIGWIREQRSG